MEFCEEFTAVEQSVSRNVTRAVVEARKRNRELYHVIHAISQQRKVFLLFNISTRRKKIVDCVVKENREQ